MPMRTEQEIREKIDVLDKILEDSLLPPSIMTILVDRGMKNCLLWVLGEYDFDFDETKQKVEVGILSGVFPSNVIELKEKASCVICDSLALIVPAVAIWKEGQKKYPICYTHLITKSE